MKRAKLLLMVIFLFHPLLGCSGQFDYYDGKTVKYISDDIFAKIKVDDFKEVEAYIDYLVKEKPYSINGTRLLEEIYWSLSQRRGVLEHYDKWCSSKAPHHSAFILRGLYHMCSAWLARGSGYAYTVSDEGWSLFKKNLELAKEDLEKAYSLNPNDPNSASSMITVYMGLRYEEEEMEKWFQRAVAADPMAYDSYSRKLLFLNPKWRGTTDKYIQFANHCYQHPPPNSIVYKIMFECLFEYLRKAHDSKKFYNDPYVKKTFDDIYHRILRNFPNSTAIRVDYAGVQYTIGRFDNATKLLKEALKIEPDNIGAIFTRADIYFNTGSFKKAEIYYKRAIEVVADDPKATSSAYFSLGKINAKKYHNYKKADEYYSKAIELYPKDEDYYVSRGFNKAMMDLNLKSALRDFNEAIKINPRHIYANHYKAMCLMDLNRCEEAIVFYNKALELIEQEMQKGDASTIKKQAAESLIKTIHSNIKRCKRLIGLHL